MILIYILGLDGLGTSIAFLFNALLLGPSCGPSFLSLDPFADNLIISSQREPIPSSPMIFCSISAPGDPSKHVLTVLG